jgi:hypothetical protein
LNHIEVRFFIPDLRRFFALVLEIYILMIEKGEAVAELND